jgi:hypothetical protein
MAPKRLKKFKKFRCFHFTFSENFLENLHKTFPIFLTSSRVYGFLLDYHENHSSHMKPDNRLTSSSRNIPPNPIRAMQLAANSQFFVVQSDDLSLPILCSAKCTGAKRLNYIK